jgi:hypothetical protein
VTPLRDRNFDPTKPFQTREGVRQALRVGHNRVAQLIADGSLKTVRFGRSVRVTTESIMALTGAEAAQKRRAQAA